MSSPAALPCTDAPQQVITLRRDYNAWVASETLEDYALRFTPQRARRWSAGRVANTAFGASSFLILEAVGATLLIQYGFSNALWAILATGLIIFAAGLPISVYAARYGVDMDLLTRGAGFGYIGSTLTSLIYASFTFIFFALEAAVMAYALELALDIPPRWGYLICALLVIPLVLHGVSAISRLQMWTLPLWLLMLAAPFAGVLWHDPAAFAGVLHQAGSQTGSAGFDMRGFGAALTVGVALITQMGEQADYLRFMPAATPQTQRRWWAAVLLGGPGWVLMGVPKMLGGALLAWLAISQAVPPERAVDPNQMYLAGYEALFPGHYGWAVAATALFVVISQLKINVTNAYAGSLAWSNFFSRLTHSHPGRVVWVLFNIGIAVLVMEMNVFEALGEVLGLFANIAIAWIMAVVADLLINKPLGLSPPGIEFKRAYLYDINPVGVGAMALASSLSIAAHLGMFGSMAQAFSALIAMATALLSAPLIAWATGGRYYLARQDPPPSEDGAPLRPRRCVVCEAAYEGPDMAHCPAYQGPICSLCCSLDARCGDLCKPQARLAAQWAAALRAITPQRSWAILDQGLAQFLGLMLLALPLLAALLGLLYRQSGFWRAYTALAVMAGVVAWWLVLTHKSRAVAQEESRRQTQALMREIASHRLTDEALQAARQVAEQANQAKSRYISAISHELRTPLNSILGYAQLMAEDGQIPPQRRQAVQVIKRSGEHLMSLIEGSLDIARIEAGKLSLNPAPMALADALHELAEMFEPQAAAKGLAFHFEPQGSLPEWVRADDKRLRQILINLIGNAIKFTRQGGITLRVRYAREMAHIEVEDSGPGLTPAELSRIFEPFTRGDGMAAPQAAPGAGLGLTIAKMLTDLMGGEMSARSKTAAEGSGAVFTLRLFLPQLREDGRARPQRVAETRRGYAGPRRRLLVVDNEEPDRLMLAELLQGLGFDLRQAASGHDALDLIVSGYRPHAVLMDLAMPGIDGWETIARLRRLCGELALTPPQIAIVSANAFEKGQPNSADLGAEDFILKPLRHAELLDWLGARLGLEWLARPAALSPAPAAISALARPDPQLLGGLRQALQLGYLRGVQQALDELVSQAPQSAEFCERLRGLAQQFQFETIQQLLDADYAH
ncbi:hybrid sensor histidine kinase/response regulator [Paucibacter sp. KCTC 42545]|uniref:hybrid sensor histidine kinase/response regulator n=1 Tax=Paucibacter sp. KCTC 42545 TaxID=1768242 RepID=UPI000733BFD6|nr:ATP-binding protein [Paucibacter sp. KCTC 42545]ALT79211.1 hybrid sensor histidine kinase/response regulator [Paucibacter sp. KCTC 42545]